MPRGAGVAAWMLVVALVAGILAGVAPGARGQTAATGEETGRGEQEKPGPPDLELGNEFIRILVNRTADATGRFSVNTTGGDPVRADDDAKPLIYGEARPWTSYTTVNVDGTLYVFGGKTQRRAGKGARYGEQVLAPTREGDVIRAIWRLGPIEVEQRLSLAESVTTGLEDTARIRYVVRNTDSRPHDVGLRILLDTMLGANDGAPFRVAERALLTDTRYEGSELPPFFQAFDSLSKPQVMSQGTLVGAGATRPDEVYFSNWGSLADGPWTFDFQPGRDFTRAREFELDSALALYWNPRPLAPGETRDYVTLYGLGGITVAAGELSLGVTSVARVAADAGHPQPFDIVAYVENTGAIRARDVTVTLTLPEGIRVVRGGEGGAAQVARRSLGDLARGESRQIRWSVEATGTVLDRRLEYEVQVQARHGDPNRVRRAVEIVRRARLSVRLQEGARVRVVDDRWRPDPLPVVARIRNDGQTTAQEVWVGLDRQVSGLALAPRELDRKLLGDLKPGEEVEVRWWLRPAGPGGRWSVAVRAESDTATPGEAPRRFVEVEPLKARVAVGEPVWLGDTPPSLAVPLGLPNVPGFARARVELLYDPGLVELLDVRRGTVVVETRWEEAAGQAWRFGDWRPPRDEPLEAAEVARVQKLLQEGGSSLGLAAGDEPCRPTALRRLVLEAGRGELGPLPTTGPDATLATLYFRVREQGRLCLLAREVSVVAADGSEIPVTVVSRSIPLEGDGNT